MRFPQKGQYAWVKQPLMTTTEAACILKCERETILNMIKACELEALIIPRAKKPLYRVRTHSLLALISGELTQQRAI